MIELSAQQITSCTYGESHSGCNGGRAEQAPRVAATEPQPGFDFDLDGLASPAGVTTGRSDGAWRVQSIDEEFDRLVGGA